jgi:hypothetical protein
MPGQLATGRMTEKLVRGRLKISSLFSNEKINFIIWSVDNPAKTATEYMQR